MDKKKSFWILGALILVALVGYGTSSLLFPDYADITVTVDKVGKMSAKGRSNPTKKFNWTLAEAKKLEKDVDTLGSIVKKFGKGDELIYYKDDETASLTYENSKEKDTGIYLGFKKKGLGDYVLARAKYNFPLEKVEISDESDPSWRHREYAELIVGDEESGEGGAKLSEVISKHGKPYEAHYDIGFNETAGVFNSIVISYSNHEAVAPDPAQITLIFDCDTQKLTNKFRKEP